MIGMIEKGQSYELDRWQRFLLVSMVRWAYMVGSIERFMGYRGCFGRCL